MQATTIQSMTKDETFCLREGEHYARVGDRIFGPWPDKGSATAGLQTEQRRAAASAVVPLTTLKYTIAGAKFTRRYLNADEAQERAAILVANGVPVVIESSMVRRKDLPKEVF